HGAREQDGPGAGPVKGPAPRDELRDGAIESVLAHQPEEHRAFAARKDEARAALEGPGKPHLDPLRTAPRERAEVRLEVSLEREDADGPHRAPSPRGHGCVRDGRALAGVGMRPHTVGGRAEPSGVSHHPRVWSSSPGSSLLVSIPLIGWPSPDETSATIEASRK